MYKLILIVVLAAVSADVLIPVQNQHYGLYPAAVEVPAQPYKIDESADIATNQYQAQEVSGQYKYGYSVGTAMEKNEERNSNGDISGGYTYTSPEGYKVSITYTAGENGFKASGDAIPKPVEPTEDVAEAARNHMAARAAAEAKIKAEALAHAAAKAEAEAKLKAEALAHAAAKAEAEALAHAAAKAEAKKAGEAEVPQYTSYKKIESEIQKVEHEIQKIEKAKGRSVPLMAPVVHTPLPYAYSQSKPGHFVSYTSSAPNVKYVVLQPVTSEQPQPQKHNRCKEFEWC